MIRKTFVLPLLSSLILLSGGCSSDSTPAPGSSGGSESAGDGGAGSIDPGAGGSAAAGGNAGDPAAGGSPAEGGGAANAGGTPGAGVGGGEDSKPGAGGGPPAGVGGGIDALSPRVRSSLNSDWLFTKGDSPGAGDLSYGQTKNWVLPTGNPFLQNAEDAAQRPEGELGADVAYVGAGFDDSTWEQINLPHDSAIAGPFTNSVSSSMGRLPSPGVSWYRKTFTLGSEQEGQSVFLDIDGAMQYSLVWVNGKFVGGWPYGYASYRLDLSEFAEIGEENTLAIRLDTPVPSDANWDSGSSRWYPGAGIYRNVWLTTTAPVHVAQWGTQLTTPEISSESASVSLDVTVDNDSADEVSVSVSTEIYELDAAGYPAPSPVATIAPVEIVIPAGSSAVAATQGVVESPRLWGVSPIGEPNMYIAYTQITQGDELVDQYKTPFGIRSIEFDGEGFRLNGELIKMEGVCLHHDLGALGAATSTRARERQLEILREMGANAIRTAHNPFEPEFYELADRMGFLVMDEAFDVWSTGKAAEDHHVFFKEWHEQDLRALIRRDRNHPSVIMWSIGNEIPEQINPNASPEEGERLTTMSHEEDPTRPTISGMNKAEPDSLFSVPIDTIGLNYQGTGVRDLGAQYPTYHAAFPDKFIVGTETTSTFSTRGTYLFPVTSERGAPASGSSGVDTQAGLISSYDLYHADWSYSPDEEFESQDKWSYVGGEFVWTGFDYIGEPTPLDSVARSSYFGILDLAGFKKDRFYLYQAQWSPELPMVHVLPHWTWPGREGQVTPVHVYTSGDSAELFINDVSQGLKERGEYEYRLRWDDAVYEAGSIRVVAYKDGQEWASTTVETAGAAAGLELSADRDHILGDGIDLSFVTLRVVDEAGRFVPQASDAITFEVSGSAQIVATDNGDPTDREPFPSPRRNAFSGLALAIVRSLPGQSGQIEVTASAAGLSPASVIIEAE